MLGQYRQLKSRFPDAILLFRLGDFYEMFEEDARLAARQLNLVLTSRRFSKKVRLPMCGIPYRQLTVYVSKLLALGHKVAVADQLEEAGQTRRLIRRDVVRVITPGTVVEEALLPQKAQNFLVALAPRCPTLSPQGTAGWGLAAVDLSTGEFVTTQLEGEQAWTRLLEELDVLQPSEILLPADLAGDEEWTAGLAAIRRMYSSALYPSALARLSPVDPACFEPAAARERLLDQLSAVSLEPYGCEGLPLATAAAGAVLSYLQDSQVSDRSAEASWQGLAHLRDLQTYHPEATVGLDAVTRRNLELTCTLRDGAVQGSLLGVLDRTVTPMGARLLRRWIQQPLLDLQRIHERLDAVEELCSSPSLPSPPSPPSPPSFLRPDLRDRLDGLHDVERLVGRIGFGTANARDVAALRRTLERIPAIRRLLEKATSAHLQALRDDLDELQDVAALIKETLVDHPPILLRDGGLIRAGCHDELARLRQAAAEGRDWLAAYEAQERERTGIPTLRVRYNQIFGFFVEVPRSKSGRVPPEYERRATITHAERFVTPELQAHEAAILSAEERANELEYELFVGLRQRVAAHTERLQRAARVLAELDVLAALAETAAHCGYTRPVVDDGSLIEIQEGRHPVVEQMLPGGVRFVANDTALDGAGPRFLIITGPNMSGKSVYIRQVALTALMAQVGSFVPARAARLGLADRIFVRAGATDDIAQGRSTFLVEMSETAYILRHATSRSLVVLDEVGRGTSTYDGMALAWAVGEDLHDRIGARTLFATHFHELTALADELDGARNAQMAAKEQGQQVVFLYRLVEGGADRSYGVQVARLAGVPEHVVERAREVMEQLSRDQGPGIRDQGLVIRDLEAGGRKEEEARELREIRAPYLPVEGQERLLVPVDDEAVWQVVRELFGLDIANLTPVQALVVLNELQRQLRGDTLACQEERYEGLPLLNGHGTMTVGVRDYGYLVCDSVAHFPSSR
jgi:DNA mismatch repair protein MutS